MTETNLVAVHRVHRQLIFLKPKSPLERGLRAHVVAVPNSGPDKVAECILRHPDELRNQMQVVLLVLPPGSENCTMEEQVSKLIDRSKCLRVRKDQVLKWATHLAKVRMPL